MGNLFNFNCASNLSDNSNFLLFIIFFNSALFFAYFLTNLILLPVLLSYCSISEAHIEKLNRTYAARKKLWDGLSIFTKQPAVTVTLVVTVLLFGAGWKVSQGFSNTQVVNKTKSLRGVLDPNTSDINIKILQKVGFKKIEIITQYLNFQTILAIK